MRLTNLLFSSISLLLAVNPCLAQEPENNSITESKIETQTKQSGVPNSTDIKTKVSESATKKEDDNVCHYTFLPCVIDRKKVKVYKDLVPRKPKVAPSQEEKGN